MAARLHDASAAFVTNGRLDVVASNALARALYSPLFSSDTTGGRGRPNFARYWFLDRASPDFVADWNSAAAITVAMLRTEAGRFPHVKSLRGLVGELSTASAAFRTRWAAHDVRIHHGGAKRFHHRDVGPLDVIYQPLDLPVSAREAHSLTVCTAEPGTAHEARLKLLASWAAGPAVHRNRLGTRSQ